MFKWLENIFECMLWNARFFVLFAVVFSLIGSVLLFVMASADIFKIMLSVGQYYLGGVIPENLNIHDVLLRGIVLSIDLYLIAVILLVFAFGLYELFISKIDIAEGSVGSRVLEIHSLDQLKDKLSKVILMALIVSFFNLVLRMNMTTSLDMLYFALSILALSLGLYFMQKSDSKH